MARIRTIKPEFWTDEKLTECSLIARLLFIGTWNFADDSGNLDRSPRQIKARVFPLDEIDCEPLLIELLAQGLLTEYIVSEKTFLHINGFNKHQIINRPSKPTCPAMDDKATLTEYSVTTHDGKEGKGRERNKHLSEYSDEFERFWTAYPKKRQVGKGGAWKSWKTKKPDLNGILSALAWQSKSTQWTKDGGQFIPMPATYLNQRRWEDTPPDNPGGRFDMNEFLKGK